MTEAYEDGWLVRVRAQVMCRDEGTGGWVALGGGGLANVMVGKRRRPASAESSGRPPHAPSYEYYIYGVRISDSEEVLSCTIKKDFQYNKVMPTFHHWVTDEKRFGLTFQTAADARAFDRGVRSAIQELLDGLGGAWPSLHAYKKHNPAPKEDDEENNIFECLNLPSDSRSSSENSTASRPRRKQTDDDITQTPILSTITLPRQTSPEEDMARRQYAITLDETRSDIVEADRGSDCPYIHLSALNTLHVYQYPSRNEIAPEKEQPTLMKRDFGPVYSDPPPLPDKKFTRNLPAFQARLKCRYCDEWYLESANRAGSCKYAPDCCKTCINTVSCIKCAQCVVYHCMSESEGDFAMRPCACAPAADRCAKRWLCVAMLSILVPCLCCYGPLRWGHRAARSAHLVGGQHAPTDLA